MTKPYVLWLIWQNKNTRQRYHVGNLIHQDGIYLYQYENTIKHRGLNEALKNGYRPHLAFPDLKKVYSSLHLFGPFARRLPNTKRPDFNSLLNKYGLSHDYTDMDLLRVTGGKLATDSYEFVQPIYFENNHFDFDFYVAGWRHYEGDNYLDQLSQNTEVILEREPGNEHDPYAIMVKTKKGDLLGYIPAFFSEFMSFILEKGYEYNSRIVSIDRLAVPQFKVNVSIHGSMNASFYKKQGERLFPIQQF